MNFNVVIPARFGSTRFPGKVLADINGKPMIQHVYQRACQSGAQAVVVAVDDERVEKAARAFGATVCLTRSDHASGTDRLAEVVEQLRWDDEQIVVNVQGDEPLIPAENIVQVAANLAGHQAAMATLVTAFDSEQQLRSRDTAKVVCDQQGYALYFSRSVIPYDRDGDGGYPYLRHVGIYAYRAGFLRRFSQLPPSPLEATEKLEQLRILAAGERIHVAMAERKPPHGVDSADDLRDLLQQYGDQLR